MILTPRSASILSQAQAFEGHWFRLEALKTRETKQSGALSLQCFRLSFSLVLFDGGCLMTGEAASCTASVPNLPPVLMPTTTNRQRNRQRRTRSSSGYVWKRLRRAAAVTGWGSPRLVRGETMVAPSASWEPCPQGRPFATTSMRCSSVCRFTCHATLTPASRQARARACSGGGLSHVRTRALCWRLPAQKLSLTSPDLQSEPATRTPPNQERNWLFRRSRFGFPNWPFRHARFGAPHRDPIQRPPT